MGQFELIFGFDNKLYLFICDKCVEIYDINYLKDATSFFESLVIGFKF